MNKLHNNPESIEDVLKRVGRTTAARAHRTMIFLKGDNGKLEVRVTAPFKPCFLTQLRKKGSRVRT